MITNSQAIKFSNGEWVRRFSRVLAACSVTLLLTGFGGATPGPIARPSAPYVGTVGADVVFNGTSSSGSIIRYCWIFGDGATDCSGPIVSHAYAQSGLFTVTLTVTDDHGRTSKATALASISDPPPPPAPLALSIVAPVTVAATDPSGIAVTYSATTSGGTAPVGTTRCSPVSGSVFPVGATSINCAVSDSAVQTASASVTVTVTYTAPTPPQPSGSLAPLQASDLTFLGQVDTPGTQYSGQSLALRYVNGERRFLTVQFTPGGTGPQDSEQIGDLVEWRIASPLMNGTQHWTLANVPGWQEVRRWKNWTTIARMKAAPAGTYSAQWKQAPYYASGVEPAALYWDDAHGVLWYTLIPQYPGTQIVWPPWNAVRLTDTEAGGNVSDANIYGPYYFSSATVTDDWKDAASGIFPIDGLEQAAMGGKYIVVGHHMANIGTKGARSIGMWVVNDLPSPPAQNTVLWPSAVHLYDTSMSSGKPFPNVHVPNFVTNAAYHGANDNEDYQVIAGVGSRANSGDAVGLSVNDCIYAQEAYRYIDTVAVFMNSGANGGSYVPEIFNGSAWVQPQGWAVSVGSADLSVPVNVFYWPKIPYAGTIPSELGAFAYDGNLVRLRRVSAGISGGSLRAAIATVSMNGAPTNDGIAIPEPVGGYVRPGSDTPQYDATHYGAMFVAAMYGGAWVKTANVEGVAYFGSVGVGGYAYSGFPMFAQPASGGAPIRYESAEIPGVTPASDGVDWSNGPRFEGPKQPYFLPFAAADMLAAAGDPAKRFSDFLNPSSYRSLYAAFPGLIAADSVTNPNSAFVGQPRLFQYFVGHSVVFDPATNQLIVLLPTYNKQNILAFFQVR